MQRILIVDDDPAGTQLLSTLLGLEGYQPFALENWKDPVSDAEQYRPDLIIMDIYLRTVNGLDLLAQLRAHPDPEVACIPVLMMSAEDQRNRCEQAGANGFLEKPFNLQVLVDTIHMIEEDSASRD